MKLSHNVPFKSWKLQKNKFPIRFSFIRNPRSYFSSFRYASEPDTTPLLLKLQKKIEEKLVEKRKMLNRLRQDTETIVSSTTPSSIIGGMRGVKSLLTDTSSLDPENGITFRGHDCYSLLANLPRNSEKFGIQSQIPFAEGVFWLLLTGDIPSADEVEELSSELANQSYVPDYVFQTLESLPVETHPMTQLIIGVASLQKQSAFSNAYMNKTIKKEEFWIYTLQDAIKLVASLPIISGFIYHRSFSKETSVSLSYDFGIDWAANIARMIGFNSPQVHELLRMHMMLHCDHEGGNVSAHTCHLVGSSLSDAFLSYAAAMAGLAGPLHGLASQECLKYVLHLKKRLNGAEPTPERIAPIVEETLTHGVIPGFGHAVLRTTDPRFLVQRDFALRNLADYDLFKIVEICYRTVPEILKKTGKVSNPYPNIDCHSGVLLQFYGISEVSFYTVLFALSRAIGLMAQLVWARALGLPIERPKSVTIDELQAISESRSEFRNVKI